MKEGIDPQPWMELYYYRLQDLGFSYIPPKIDKKIILFKAQEQSDEFSVLSEPTNFLQRHTTEAVSVHLIPGNHNTILSLPNVRYIGDILNSSIKYSADPALLCQTP
jgi:hypothetical protein